MGTFFLFSPWEEVRLAWLHMEELFQALLQQEEDTISAGTVGGVGEQACTGPALAGWPQGAGRERNCAPAL